MLTISGSTEQFQMTASVDEDVDTIELFNRIPLASSNKYINYRVGVCFHANKVCKLVTIVSQDSVSVVRSRIHVGACMCEFLKLLH